jgi:predicted transcriptional regulator YheO
LKQWLQEAVLPVQDGVHEEFEHDVDSILDRLIQDSIRSTGKEIKELTREDKVAVISYLENKGAFLIRYSVDRVAELLNISKYTIRFLMVSKITLSPLSTGLSSKRNSRYISFRRPSPRATDA